MPDDKTGHLPDRCPHCGARRVPEGQAAAPQRPTGVPASASADRASARVRSFRRASKASSPRKRLFVIIGSFCLIVAVAAGVYWFVFRGPALAPAVEMRSYGVAFRPPRDWTHDPKLPGNSGYVAPDGRAYCALVPCSLPKGWTLDMFRDEILANSNLWLCQSAKKTASFPDKVSGHETREIVFESVVTQGKPKEGRTQVSVVQVSESAIGVLLFGFEDISRINEFERLRGAVVESVCACRQEIEMGSPRENGAGGYTITPPKSWQAYSTALGDPDVLDSFTNQRCVTDADMIQVICAVRMDPRFFGTFFNKAMAKSVSTYTSGDPKERSLCGRKCVEWAVHFAYPDGTPMCGKVSVIEAEKTHNLVVTTLLGYSTDEAVAALHDAVVGSLKFTDPIVATEETFTSEEPRFVVGIPQRWKRSVDPSGKALAKYFMLTESLEVTISRHPWTQDGSADVAAALKDFAASFSPTRTSLGSGFSFGCECVKAGSTDVYCACYTLHNGDDCVVDAVFRCGPKDGVLLRFSGTVVCRLVAARNAVLKTLKVGDDVK